MGKIHCCFVCSVGLANVRYPSTSKVFNTVELSLDEDVYGLSRGDCKTPSHIVSM